MLVGFLMGMSQLHFIQLQHSWTRRGQIEAAASLTGRELLKTELVNLFYLLRTSCIFLMM